MNNRTETELVAEARRIAARDIMHGRKTTKWGTPWTVVRVTGTPGMGGCFRVYGVERDGSLNSYSDTLIHV